MAIVKTNLPGFVKDEKSGIVTNVDTSGLAEYQSKKSQFKRLKSMEEAIQKLQTKIAYLEGKLAGSGCSGDCPCKAPVPFPRDYTISSTTMLLNEKDQNLGGE